MKSKKYIALLIGSLIFLLMGQSVKPCGFYETEADYQAMMFRAMLPGMKCMRPFTYTMRSIYYEPYYESLGTDPEETDHYRNCMEWLRACDQSVLMKDIYKIQYDTDGSLFVKAYKNNKWQDDFADNTFVKFLIRTENKALLDYMAFAKEVEQSETSGFSRFEEWNSSFTPAYYQRSWNNGSDKAGNAQTKLLSTAWERLNKTSSVFLQQRYAFQVCRLRTLADTMTTEIENANVYEKYFGNVQPDNLMSIWAGLFHALSTNPQNNDRYRFLIRVFDNSNEKKFRCVQMFRDQYDVDSLSREEQSVAIVMKSVRNPARALDQIREAYALDKNNKHIPFLVLREINKLEDWLITPLFFDKYSITNNDPFQSAYYDRWLEEYYKENPEVKDDETEKRLQGENFTADMQYMARFKSQLDKMLSDSKGDTRDFYAVSLAHLSLLQENASGARKYLSMISDSANVTIQLQKNLETIWLAIKTKNINSEEFQNVFLQNIANLEKVSAPGYESNKMLYTLMLSLANEYLKKNNRVYGDLMRLKSDIYHYSGTDAWSAEEESWYIMESRSDDSYTNIEYFDKNATIQDMDSLISLLDKKDKSPFEQYLCDQPLSSVNAYKDLKGTIAFRNNDLQLAYQTFASMPQDYWCTNHFSFSAYLNEDPFIPKVLQGNRQRKYDYKFNKAEFVKELLSLQEKAQKDPSSSSDCYIRLGNAFFNTSYWGNAWMMTRYSQSVNDELYTRIEYLPLWMKNYMTAGIAKEYYEKAQAKAVNDEQRAYASLMLYSIHRCRFHFREIYSDKMLSFRYGKEFMKYGQTEIFKKTTYECPGIENFLTNKTDKKDEK